MRTSFVKEHFVITTSDGDLSHFTVEGSYDHVMLAFILLSNDMILMILRAFILLVDYTLSFKDHLTSCSHDNAYLSAHACF